MPPPVKSARSLRDLALLLGLSRTTISDALRGKPRVRPETAKRVHEAVKATGYTYNQFAGALISAMKRSHASAFRGVVAVVDMDGPDGRPSASVRYHDELFRGATERAEALGYKTDLFVLGKSGMTTQRLESVLSSRGIRGLLLLPVDGSPDITKFNWQNFAGIYADYVIEHPALHNVCPSHYRGMLLALERLRSLGYKTPGLVIQDHHDERLLHRWEAANWTWQTYHASSSNIPTLVSTDIDARSFKKWFVKYNPDVVLCHRLEVMEWMRECGAIIPQTHGFCCLNITATNGIPCAGLDLQPRMLGARGVEQVIAQLQRNECGIPEFPSTISVPAQWVDGPTVKIADAFGSRRLLTASRTFISTESSSGSEHAHNLAVLL